ncbi:acyltransferase family protein, partial [Komagataeibacter xylinus]
MVSRAGNCNKNYRADIDGLRAVSVLSVIIFHAFPNLLPGGFIGVDIFFVISGYLITKIIINNIEKDNIKIFDFYRHRVRRIFPALITILL